MARPDGVTAPDPPTDAGDVVAWGSDDPPRPGPLSSIAAWLRVRERNLTIGLAVVGALLAGLSLLSAWQVTTMPADRADLPATIDTPVAGLDAWGSAYLIGLLGLLAAAALALFGAGVVRGHARIAGLGWAAGMLALLLATAANLSRPGPTLHYLYLITDSDQPTVGVGSGPFLALAGVGLLATALYLHGQAEPAVPADTEESTPEGARAPAPARPVPEPPPAGPTDLTVTEATPFVHLPEPRDRW